MHGTLEYLRTNRVDPEAIEALSLLERAALHAQPHRPDRPLRAAGHLLGAGHEELDPQPQRPELLDGRAHRPACVQNYRVISEDLAAHRCDIVPTDEVHITAENPVAVDPLNPVHDVHNPREWNQRAVSLHVYSRPFDSCIVYSVEQCSCGEIGLQYTSKFGKLC